MKTVNPVRRPLLHAVRQPDIEIANDQCQSRLNLLSCKEPTRARVLPVTEMGVAHIGGGELVPVRIFGGPAAEFVKAPWIKCFGV